MTHFKLGRRSPLFTPRHMKAALLVNQVLASFGAPPPKSAPFTAAVKVPWGMYLNDSLGDCLVEGTKVSAPDAVAGYRASYYGPVIEITTSSGNRLTVTPNHGVLTPRGFVTANSLKHGDDLISTRGAQPLPWAPFAGTKHHVNNLPTPIEKIFTTLALSGRSLRKVVPVSVDFHGDERFINGNVDIVGTDRLLRCEPKAPLSQPYTQNKIGATGQLQRHFHRLGAAFEAFLRTLSPAHSYVGLGGHRTSFGHRHSSVTQAQGLGLTSRLMSCRSDGFFKPIASDTKFLADFSHGSAGQISGDRGREIAVASGTCDGARLPSGSKFIASRLHPTSQGLPTDPDLSSNLLNAFPGLVTTDRVVNINARDKYEGHIYDLSTERQWYIADGIVTHNCVCAYAAHALLLRTANVGTPVVATDNDVLTLYETIGGYNPSDPGTDQGCQESDLCQYMIDTGFLGHKSAGTAPIVTGVMTPTSIDHMKWACQVFVGIQLGVNLPASAQTQFPGQPWDVGGDETIEGGHCVGMFGYDEQYAYLSTWGAIQPATWAWVTKFVEEAHADLFMDAIRASGTTPAGFGAHTMVRDLAAIAA
jgi:hypothetical protein